MRMMTVGPPRVLSVRLHTQKLFVHPLKAGEAGDEESKAEDLHTSIRLDPKGDFSGGK
jgi:hypothetical protein